MPLGCRYLIDPTCRELQASRQTLPKAEGGGALYS